MINRDKIEINRASVNHLSRILQISKENSLSRLSKKSAENTGFLVSDFSKNEYEKFIKTADYFFVAQKDDEVLGFVLAYSSRMIKKNEWLNMLIKARHPEDFVLIKQICVKRELAGKGVADILYRYLFKEAAGEAFYTAIVLDPPNPRSFAFHEKHGFKKVMEERPPDGMLRGVWRREKLKERKISNPSSKNDVKNESYDLSILIEQYKTAVDLYKHEDTLNWHKLNNLFYVSAGLWAVIGFLFLGKEFPEFLISSKVTLIIIVCIIGLIKCTAFGIAIWSGVSYMYRRKCSMAAIEKLLMKHGGTQIIISPKNAVHRSKTILMLRIVPILLALIYVIVGTAAILIV